MNAEQLAGLFHETYEELAPDFNYQTRKASAKPWSGVPENNKRLMIAVAEKVISVQKKRVADDCIEDCAIIDDNKYLRKTISLLKSMIYCGESFTKESRDMVEKALKEE